MGGRKGKASRGGSPPAGEGVGWRWVTAIFLVALAYRALCFSTAGGHPLLRYPVVDAGYHDGWARRMAAGDWLGHGPDDVFKPPVYPLFLAGLYRLFGRHIQIVQWVQLVCGSVSCALLALLAGRLLGRWTGRLAGIIAALYAPQVFFELQLLTPVLSVLLNTAGLLLLLRYWHRPGHAWLAAAGAVLGLSAGVRPDVLLPVLLLLGLLLWRERGHAWPRAAGRCACVLAGAAAVILPVTLRNYRITGDVMPVSSNAGINLYVGNVVADGTTAVPVGLRWERLISQIDQATLERPAAAGRFWMRRTFRHVWARPAAALARLGRKALAFFNRREFRNNICFHFFQRLCRPLRPPFIQYAVVLPLGVCGLVWLWLSGRRQERAALGVCLSWVGGYWAAGVVFFVTGRFRLPAAMLLIVPAAWALVRSAEAVRRREGKTLAGHAAAVLAAGALCWPMWFGRPESAWVRDYVNLGNSLRMAGDLRAAEGAYRQALARRPDDPDANYLLGRLVVTRDRAAGLVHLESARRVLPDSPDLLLLLGQVYLTGGRADDARQALRELLDLESRCNLWLKRSAWARAHLVLVSAEPSQTEAHWREAWRIDPQTAAEAALLARRELPRVLETFRAEAGKKPWDWYSQANHGLALLTMARPVEAEAPLRKAARLAPEREGVRFHLARALAEAGRPAEAVEILRRLREALPECPLRRQVDSLLSRLVAGRQ